MELISYKKIIYPCPELPPYIAKKKKFLVYFKCEFAPKTEKLSGWQVCKI